MPQNELKIQMEITLNPTTISDFERLFVFQSDMDGIQMAAFMPPNPLGKEAFLEKWINILQRTDVNMQTIYADGIIVGSIGKYDIEGDAQITYWLDKAFWGKGIATEALTMFLAFEKQRPMFGSTAFDNIGSQRVLEKCGFVKIRSEIGFAAARNKDIVEFIYRLD